MDTSQNKTSRNVAQGAAAPTRVLLVDDHTLVRAGLRSLLESIEGVVVAAEALDGDQAVDLAASLSPDVVLMDIAMGAVNGLVAAEKILLRDPRCRIIVLSMHSSGEYVRKAMQIGVAGYLMKDSAPLELELALHAVMRNENYLSPAVAKQVIGDYKELSPAESRLSDALTPRQIEILRLIARGHTTKQVATILDISQKTAESHRTQLMERLDIHDLAGLVRFAIRQGLISADE